VTALDVRVVRHIGELCVDVALTVDANEIVAVVGPNGAGKSTLLRVLAGLLPLDDGVIRLDGRVLDDPASNVFVPPERRPIGVVFQDGLLFAHMNARDNVAFGLRTRGTNRRQAREKADRILERVGLGGMGGAKPRAMSGGQAQRVALARALASSPRVLLLDEPLAALDAGTRLEVRRVLRAHLGGYEGLRVLVTHDPVDALTLAQRIVVLERGLVVQQGTPSELRARPRSRYVAQLLGINLLEGDLAADGTLLLTTGASLDVVAPDLAGQVVAVIEPNAVTLFAAPPSGSARNMWQTRVVDLDHEPGRVRVRLGGPVPIVAEVTPAAVTQLRLEPGAEIWAAVKATAIDVSPR
jgi:molybdate transport system ATP-binding protein